MDYPITPPPERFKQWEDDILNERDNVDHVLDCAWKDGFRAGADQELEAWCEWLMAQKWFNDSHIKVIECLRTARRPKPPSLAENALSELNLTADFNGAELSRTQVELIRAALERLQELEGADG